ncbi:RNA transcription, translation and transport factor protein isoform X1 [Sylvia atricapilla]|uniref:RNA transcription, translation and transport factor protein isoform X1 n=1 Tax=Sylvia atricapilla TaxID=48155 RepID=UPI003399D9F7
MFRRKLSALDYHNPAGFNCRDETEFRNFIVWLEDQKIRHYKIEDRGNLRNIHSEDWPKSFEKYMKDVNCPFKIQERQETVDWLLGLAVRLEYGDNADKYKDSTPDGAKNADNTAKNAEPLINLDVNNPDFKAGVMALANLLQIQRHDDYLVMLKAIRILVQERLTQDAIAKASQSKEMLLSTKLRKSSACCTSRSSESCKPKSTKPSWLSRPSLLTPRLTTDWAKWGDEGRKAFSPFSVCLVQLGTTYSSPLWHAV